MGNNEWFDDFMDFKMSSSSNSASDGKSSSSHGDGCGTTLWIIAIFAFIVSMLR